MELDTAAFEALQDHRCGDPFAILGPHRTSDGGLFVRQWQPGAERVMLLPDNGGPLPVPRVHPAGLFEVALPAGREDDYQLVVVWPYGRVSYARDPYAFGLLLPEWDLARFAEGRHHHLGDILGAVPTTAEGVDGVRFAVWAPNARSVAVIGDWNRFDPRPHPMRKRHPGGVWELFLPGLLPGQRYKYDVLGADGVSRQKADPCARQAEVPPATASIVAAPSVDDWHDDDWLEDRRSRDPLAGPMAIYEVHVGSWRRDADGRALGYRELADPLIGHCRDCGFTHVEFLPLNAHPYEGSWGYQASGYFAPNSRHGSPDDLRHLIDRLHGAGIGVLVDVVPGHFPKDDFALARFDGSPCYEYGDPREGEHREWGTLVYNYRRPEVRNFLIASCLHWVDRYHVDGLRIDAVSSLLYRDYGRRTGEWVPNEDGGNANLEAASFLRELNGIVRERFPGVMTIAEESTAWQGTTAPTAEGGLGFHLKWNMGWMHDTLRYLAQDPLMRSGCHDWITFHQWYAYDERWVLPLSHDEVVHGKGSLLDKMHGDYRQRLASLRLLYGYQVAVPGRPLLFQGAEIGQGREWNWQEQVAWEEGDYPERAALCTFLAAALDLYRREPALHAADDTREGFVWVDVENRQESILGFLRRAPDARGVLVMLNFTPVLRRDYPVGVGAAGTWEVLLDSDAEAYGGDDAGEATYATRDDERLGTWPSVLRVTLPPLSVVFLAEPG